MPYTVSESLSRAVLSCCAGAVLTGCVDLTFTYDVRSDGLWSRVAWTLPDSVVSPSGSDPDVPIGLAQAELLCDSLTLRRAGLSPGDVGFATRSPVLSPGTPDPVRCAAQRPASAPSLSALSERERLTLLPGPVSRVENGWEVGAYGSFAAVLEASRHAQPPVLASDRAPATSASGAGLSLSAILPGHDAADVPERTVRALEVVLADLLADLRVTVVIRGAVQPGEGFREAPDGDHVWVGRGLQALYDTPSFVILDSDPVPSPDDSP